MTWQAAFECEPAGLSMAWRAYKDDSLTPEARACPGWAYMLLLSGSYTALDVRGVGLLLQSAARRIRQRMLLARPPSAGRL